MGHAVGRVDDPVEGGSFSRWRHQTRQRRRQCPCVQREITSGGVAQVHVRRAMHMAVVRDAVAQPNAVDEGPARNRIPFSVRESLEVAEAKAGACPMQAKEAAIMGGRCKVGLKAAQLWPLAIRYC